MKGHKNFKVLRTWKGTSYRLFELVKCPECGINFVRDINHERYCIIKIPSVCPGCRYPWTYYQKLREELENKGIPKVAPPFNPTARVQ